MPSPAALAISEVEQAMPAAPMSWMPFSRSAAYSSRQDSISCLPAKGSPTWTLGRLAAVREVPPWSRSSSPNSSDARIEAPPGWA
jgi:hypothetical protein